MQRLGFIYLLGAVVTVAQPSSVSGSHKLMVNQSQTVLMSVVLCAVLVVHV